ncbi:MAG: tyrosine-protein phosphatase [Firmicutes bacterium]|nr:tyrosine-protein phosphatase [Bacillota bacterium]
MSVEGLSATPHLRGATNFRDLGGFQTEAGAMVRSGLIFRSDDLSRAPDTDLEQLARLKLKLIFDLRTNKERGNRPHKAGRAGIKIVNIPMQAESQAITARRLLKFIVQNPRQLDFGLLKRKMYHNMVQERTGQVGKIIALLSDKNNLPAAIHCSGGMDRTGYISALIQLLLGLPYPTVMGEYLRSNDLMRPRMRRLAAVIKWATLFQIRSEHLQPLLEVQFEYLDCIIKKIIHQYGSVENYMCSACHLDEGSIAAIKELLVE